MKVLRIVMAGGGTGGHLYPGLAVGEALGTILGGYGGGTELVWAATERAVDQRLLSGFGERYVKQAVQPLVKSIGKLWGFWSGWRKSCRYWEERFSKETFDCVVALGGYAAGPAAYVAAKRGVPVVLLNPDALPGRANRFLLKRADVVVTQWPLAKEYEAGVKGKVMPLGCPIRRGLVSGISREEAGRKLGVDGSLKTLVVTGASLGAKTINDAVLEMLGDGEIRAAFEVEGLPPKGGTPAWQIVHLSGMDQAEEVRKAYAKFPRVRAKVIDYCDDMASLWAMTDIAIAR
ncbi:MAG TPA: UDP-N-acetylglucosamine--N-acetylmuramyl-(pentapeptide) pyrophosphoryl-undecaprenol N-acetylglucosamine transferase, partial [Phycisphaerae bacterium]